MAQIDTWSWSDWFLWSTGLMYINVECKIPMVNTNMSDKASDLE